MKNELVLPASVRVAAFDFEIINWATKSANSRNRFGEFCCVEKVIRIDEQLDKASRINTLFHEINHAIYWAYGMDDADKEERLISMFATAWTQVFRDNPDILVFVSESLK